MCTTLHLVDIGMTYLKHKTLSQAPKELSCELQIKSFMICMSHCTSNSLLISYGIINVKDISQGRHSPQNWAKHRPYSQWQRVMYFPKFTSINSQLHSHFD